jgi:hypothetical protein
MHASGPILEHVPLSQNDNNGDATFGALESSYARIVLSEVSSDRRLDREHHRACGGDRERDQ